MIALSNDARAAVLDDKVSRKVLLHENSMMLVEFTFKKGGIGQPSPVRQKPLFWKY